jgi:hypothetical protein
MDSCSIFLFTVGGLVAVIVVGALIAGMLENAKVAEMAPDERAAYLAQKNKRAEENRAKVQDLQNGQLNSAMICPHCQSKGTVRTKHVKQKKGISGTKATAAVLTAGVSILATGLSRKEGMTQASCDRCRSTWYF